ncbi:hypothetical protein C2G38_2228533 [Gigaspora rosea]|uniref:Uncharacterized protein n=1 Tax=Gigaspora rosea TaxID=44941 RepID=A0A397TZ13_9GLOM|nr:hypothetical protein C2G38_2228533 [Gigaspora rosea]
MFKEKKLKAREEGLKELVRRKVVSIIFTKTFGSEDVERSQRLTRSLVLKAVTKEKAKFQFERRQQKQEKNKITSADWATILKKREIVKAIKLERAKHANKLWKESDKR